MKRIISYIFVLIMVVQVLPSHLFEQDANPIVMLNMELEGNDTLNEKLENEQNEITLYNHNALGIIPEFTFFSYDHSYLLHFLKKDIFTPPPNIS